MDNRKFAECYQRIFYPFTFLTSLLLFVLRWTYGGLFMGTGGGKLDAPDKFYGFFESLGIPFPEFQVHLVGGIEYVGGFLLMIGLASRLVALPLFVTMVVAMVTAHGRALSLAFSSWNPLAWDLSVVAAESPFPYLVMCLMVIIWGPGRFSIDAIIKYIGNR